jgi:hypothetical protein
VPDIITIQVVAAATDAILPSAERDDLKRGSYQERTGGQAAASVSPGYGVRFEDQRSSINLKKA